MAQPDRATLTSAITRYRVMARVVGTALVLLVLVAMPLKYAAGQPLGVEVLGPLHGFLYLAYLVTVLELAGKADFRPLQIVAMVAAGLVPFLTFVVERRMERTLTVTADDERPTGTTACPPRRATSGTAGAAGARSSARPG